MKKTMTIILSALLAFSLATPLVAAEGKKKAGSEKSDKAKFKTKKRNTFPYYGAIGKVDAKSFTIIGKSSTRTFLVDDKTRITIDGKKASLSDFKMGQQVSGTCKRVSGKESTYLAVSMKPRPARKKKSS